MGDLHGLMVSICSLSKHGAQSTPIHNLINPRLNNLVLGMSAISFHHLSNNDAMTPTVKPILLYPDNSKAIKDDITWLLAPGYLLLPPLHLYTDSSLHSSSSYGIWQHTFLTWHVPQRSYPTLTLTFPSWLCLCEYEVLHNMMLYCRIR